ncbi:MAG: hypothetical protein ABIR70_08625 [Bryobacteraceae bacterium]
MSVDLACPTCSTKLRESEKDCPSCGSFCWFPNVRKAENPVERAALDASYDIALSNAKARGVDSVLASYTAALADSVAVVCQSLDQVKTLLSSDRPVFISFHQQRSSKGRRPEDTPIETQRVATDARVFPFYFEEIKFAALSLDGKGASSYGGCSLVLRSVAIQKRTSVFWENSVDFCNRVCAIQSDPIPAGYRAPWASRAKLATAKGEPLLGSGTSPTEFSRILLEGDRFVEVHIYGPFNRESFDRLLLPKPTKKDEKAMVAAIREVISNDGLPIKVEEYL